MESESWFDFYSWTEMFDFFHLERNILIQRLKFSDNFLE